VFEIDKLYSNTPPQARQKIEIDEQKEKKIREKKKKSKKKDELRQYYGVGSR
jgi:hypothetical protein